MWIQRLECNTTCFKLSPQTAFQLKQGWFCSCLAWCALHSGGQDTVLGFSTGRSHHEPAQSMPVTSRVGKAVWPGQLLGPQDILCSGESGSALGSSLVSYPTPEAMEQEAGLG